MLHRPLLSYARRFGPAAAAVLALAACGGAATAPGGGGGTGGGTSFSKGDLFVSATTGNDANDGTRQHPVATIQRAFQLAGDTGTLRVAGGTYTEQIALMSHINIYGGYDPSSWKRDTAAWHTMVGDSAAAVVAKDVSSVTLDGLYLSTLISTPYAVVLVDSSAGIEIRGSTISAARGFDGPNAGTWSYRADTGAAGATGQPAHGCPPSVTGGAGGSGLTDGASGGIGGTGGLLGGFDGSGGKGSGGGSAGKGGAAFTAGAPGHAPGSAGAAGPDGAGGPGFTRFNYAGGYHAGYAQYGSEGAPGAGGGGGGGGGGIFVLGICGGGGGGGGQGGQGGSGGVGGGNGWASIGVVVMGGSQVQIDGGAIVTAGGGNGGNGAAGQLGGIGGLGGNGGAASAGAGAGGKGGAGGTGGQGGWGGAGGGGPSIGVLVLDNATYSGNGVAYHIGPGGTGGSANSAFGAGAPGDTASVKDTTSSP